MEIVIHGTKGGRKIFTPNKTAGLIDVTSDSPKANAIGSSAYAIRFTANNTIFSKYKIIRDVRGDKRTGFVGFSLFLSNKERLSGTDIVRILDDVSFQYNDKYIVENNLNEVIEDWEFLENILNEYKSKISIISDADVEILQSGNKDDAYVYFKDKKHLHSFFDSPVHEEYIEFRQVIIVDSEFANTLENPLNAMRYSDNNLTEKIDLENTYYKLSDYSEKATDGVNVEIRVNNILKRNREKIFKKDKVTIRYSKNKYFKSIDIEGKLTDSNVEKYLKINNSTTIEVEKNIILEKEEKIITIEINNNEYITNQKGEISCKAKFSGAAKDIHNNKIQFLGEEAKERWIILVKNGNHSGQTEFTPEHNETVQVVLKEYLKIQIKVLDIDNGDRIADHYKIYCQGHRESNRSISEIEFIDNEIDKTWNMSATANRYQNSSNLEFCPRKNQNEIVFKLKKTEYRVSTDIPIFEGEGDDGGHKPKKKEPFFRNRKLIIALAAVSIIFIASAWLLFNKNNKENITTTKIANYTDGDALFLTDLIELKQGWQLEQPPIDREWSFLGLFDGKKTKVDSTKYKTWESFMTKIDYAVKIRNSINDKDFSALNSFSYSSNQKDFEYAIRLINETNKDIISDKLENISIVKLSTVAKDINNILKNKNIVEDEVVEELPKEVEHVENPVQSNKVPTIKDDSMKAADKTIVTYLQGSELKKVILLEYKDQTRNPSLIKSIDIVLNAWNLDPINKTYRNLQKDCDEDKYLKDSELNKILISVKKDADYAGLKITDDILKKIKTKK